MGKANSQTNPKSTNNKFWQFRNLADDDQKAELLLYGDISERSWWEDAATPKRFADDLAALGDVKEITVYINSGGGDVFAAQAIGNMLERNAATVTAHIDGLCASAATIVACHADKVVAAADGSYMVHPVSMGVCDYLTAEDMKNCLKALETIRSSIITLYAKKSGKTEDECAKWMDETNWWTATEAQEKGFVDEVDDDAEDSVVENRNGVLFVNSISMNTPFNEAPNFVRSRVTEKPVNRPENMNPAEKPERNDHGEVKNMDIKTTDDLRKAYPDLVATIENEAITAERTRIQEIENATLPGAEDQANEAKFTKPVDSASFAKAVIASMKAKQQEQSKNYLNSAKAAAENSNANSIDNTPPANPEAEDEESKAFMNAIRIPGNWLKKQYHSAAFRGTMKLYWSRCCGQMGASGQTGRGKEARKNHAGNDHCSHCNSTGRRRHCRRAALRCGELSHSSPGVPPGQRRKKGGGCQRLHRHVRHIPGRGRSL